MTVSELVKQEFIELYPSIFNNHKTKVSFEDIMDTDAAPIEELLESLREEDGVNLKEKENLTAFLTLVERSYETTYQEDDSIEKEFREFVACNPGIKAFQYFLITYLPDYYTDIEMFDYEWVNFYKTVFEEHPEIVNLDDFVHRSSLLVPIYILETRPDLYIETFRKAVINYPQKPILKSALSLLYQKNSDYVNAIKSYHEFLSQIEKIGKGNTQISTDFIAVDDHLMTYRSLAELYFKINDFANSLRYISKLLDHYANNKEDDFVLDDCFVAPMFIKIQIHMAQKDIDSFREDFSLFQSTVDTRDYADYESFKIISEFSKGL